MMNTPVTPVVCPEGPVLNLIIGFFWAVVGGAVILALMILLLPDKVFLAISNYLQIIAAIAGALSFLYAWHRSGGQVCFLYAAGGFGLWGVSNIAWYAVVLMGQRALVFPSIIDLGMISSFLLLSRAFRSGLPRNQVPHYLLLLILAICLIMPVGVMIVAGINASTIITLAYFFACGSFLVMGLNHSLPAYPEILAGALLFALTFMIYPIRELFLVQNPVLPVIGTFVSAGFALMVIGWLSIRSTAKRAGES
jgi:hypothetical protein